MKKRRIIEELDLQTPHDPHDPSNPPNDPSNLPSSTNPSATNTQTNDNPTNCNTNQTNTNNQPNPTNSQEQQGVDEPIWTQDQQHTIMLMVEAGYTHKEAVAAILASLPSEVQEGPHEENPLQEAPAQPNPDEEGEASMYEEI